MELKLESDSSVMLSLIAYAGTGAGVSDSHCPVIKCRYHCRFRFVLHRRRCSQRCERGGQSGIAVSTLSSLLEQNSDIKRMLTQFG